jgi:hypothetical protein
MVAKLSRGAKARVLSAGSFDGLSGGRSSSLLGGLVARVAPAPQLAPLPKSSFRAAPKRVQEAVKVVEDYVESLGAVEGGKGVKPVE